MEFYNMHFQYHNNINSPSFFILTQPFSVISYRGAVHSFATPQCSKTGHFHIAQRPHYHFAPTVFDSDFCRC